MTWATDLTRTELVESIAVFATHPDFLKARDALLVRAVQQKDIELIRLLLEAGATTDGKDESTGDSLLHYLVHEYRVTRTSAGSTVLEITRLLLQHGADPEWVGAGNWRALDHCIDGKLAEMADLLIQFGANPRQREYI